MWVDKCRLGAWAIMAALAAATNVFLVAAFCAAAAVSSLRVGEPTRGPNPKT